MPPSSQAATARANILGVGVSAINMAQALEFSDRLIQQRGKGYICVTGVHGIMASQSDAALRKILNQSFLCTPDGMPTVWVGRLQAHRGMRRVYGPDYMLEMCRLSVARGYRHFLCGGKAGVAGQLKCRLEHLIPEIMITGTYTPPFRSLSLTEEEALIAQINQARPDVVWVGLSTPKQERFMAQHIDRFQTSLIVGVGAAFEIHAGLVSEAPRWMKVAGLQWLDRLAKEPRRLWRRYLSTIPLFLWNISLQLSGMRRFELR